MMAKLYLGIDPGLSGALAFFSPGGAMEVFDMPTHTVKSNGKNRRKIDFHGLAAIVRDRAAFIHAGLIEEVNAMPGQGVTSMFSFGKAAGAVEMALAALQVPYDMVTPQKWKKALRVTSNKDEARRVRQGRPPVRNACPSHFPDCLQNAQLKEMRALIFIESGL